MRSLVGGWCDSFLVNLLHFTSGFSAAKIAATELLDTGWVDGPLPSSAGISFTDLDEALVDGQVVSHCIAPGQSAGSVEGLLDHDLLVDVWKAGGKVR